MIFFFGQRSWINKNREIIKFKKTYALLLTLHKDRVPPSHLQKEDKACKICKSSQCANEIKDAINQALIRKRLSTMEKKVLMHHHLENIFTDIQYWATIIISTISDIYLIVYIFISLLTEYKPIKVPLENPRFNRPE